MSDEIDLLARWMELPEVNREVVNFLLDDCMAPAEYVGTMKVLNLRLNQEEANAGA